ncbi:MAG: RNA polymerase sigma factor [Gammaproteobacteria bacterium]|nr:RNA polymerase sigma factor [Gammaproteobacteria bacterium]
MRDGDALENNPHVSRSALEAIHSQVFGWALSRCNFDHMAAEDLVQQAYVELLSGRARFDNKSSLKTFVFAIVQNLVRNRYRRLASRLRLAANLAAQPRDIAVIADEPGPRGEVWKAVYALPARQRDIIELVFCRELTIEEASSVMGVSIGTGRAHYDRAKKALRTKLADTSVTQNDRN